MKITSKYFGVICKLCVKKINQSYIGKISKTLFSMFSKMIRTLKFALYTNCKNINISTKIHGELEITLRKLYLILHSIASKNFEHNV